ncbi:Phosphatidylinositol 4-phosphate 5-kinase [Actinidia chinensis var. chinensis]|uniref:Phosphatidylinositol 4-phosphate 5-kinase n=1 Tax=Actinidia chinensis var. chinensis TaxID=1590841 RepID=A0A2R6Q6G9_ACTCC|nr:Phosphatidylinositol 4-phosphate 5-kinase [Actinidia chinensis var. chinensis]
MESSERFSEKVFLNGDTYVGNFKGIFPHGKGKYTWVDGTVYEGNWEEGKMTGKGQIFLPSGATYEGDFSGGYLHGFGTFTRPDGSNYRGAWKMNAQHGLGRKEYHYSDVYDGLWKEGVQEGRGRYAWSNGNTYIGNWKDGKMCGRGVMKWVNGDLFDGFWLNGFRHGSGCYRFADGSYYFGTWTKGLKDGHGTYYPAGSKHPSLRRLCSCDKYEGKRKGLLSHSSSLNSVECRVQSPIVKRSFSEKISINGLLRGSSLRSHRTTSLDEGWSLGDSTREFSSCDLPCMLTHSSDGGQHEVEDNASVVFEREYMQGVLIKEWIRKSTGLSYKSKHRRKFYTKEMKKRSFVDIFEGHRSCYLMLNLQLGISRNLRQLFKLDAAEYMMSICGDDGLRELSSPGKSGSIFYISHDDRFFIKTLRRSELKILLKMLPKYYDHVKDHENTLITKFFGFHQITLTGGRKVRFVVMGNMFWTELRVHRRFDLKGSTHGRITNQDGIDDSTTLKDRDLQFEFHMDKLLRESLFKQLNLDCMFLESQKIIDYSLLLGLHFRAPEQLPGLEPPDALHKHENLHQTDDAISQEFPIPPKGLLLVTHEPSSVSVAPGPHSRGNTLRAFSVGDQEVDLLLPGTARLRVQLGVNMPAQARRKLSQEETDSEDAELYEVYDVVLYLGIIDILQNYNMKKKIEHAYKSLQHDPMSISSVEPKLYSKRFIDFLEKVFPYPQQT